MVAQQANPPSSAWMWPSSTPSSPAHHPRTTVRRVHPWTNRWKWKSAKCQTASSSLVQPAGIREHRSTGGEKGSGQWTIRRMKMDKMQCVWHEAFVNFCYLESEMALAVCTDNKTAQFSNIFSIRFPSNSRMKVELFLFLWKLIVNFHCLQLTALLDM